MGIVPRGFPDALRETTPETTCAGFVCFLLHNVRIPLRRVKQTKLVEDFGGNNLDMGAIPINSTLRLVPIKRDSLSVNTADEFRMVFRLAKSESKYPELVEGQCINVFPIF